MLQVAVWYGGQSDICVGLHDLEVYGCEDADTTVTTTTTATTTVTVDLLVQELNATLHKLRAQLAAGDLENAEAIAAEIATIEQVLEAVQGKLTEQANAIAALRADMDARQAAVDAAIAGLATKADLAALAARLDAATAPLEYVDPTTMKRPVLQQPTCGKLQQVATNLQVPKTPFSIAGAPDPKTPVPKKPRIGENPLHLSIVVATENPCISKKNPSISKNPSKIKTPFSKNPIQIK